MARKSNKPKKPKPPKPGRFDPLSPAPAPLPHEFPNIFMCQEVLQYRLNPNCRVRVGFEGIVTQKAVKKLIAYLEIAMEEFPEEVENPRVQF